MADTIDSTVSKQMDQAFAAHHDSNLGSRERRTQGVDHLAEVARARDLQSAFLTGAVASQELRTSAISREILQARAVDAQPTPNKA